MKLDKDFDWLCAWRSQTAVQGLLCVLNWSHSFSCPDCVCKACVLEATCHCCLSCPGHLSESNETNNEWLFCQLQTSYATAFHLEQDYGSMCHQLEPFDQFHAIQICLVILQRLVLMIEACSQTPWTEWTLIIGSVEKGLNQDHISVLSEQKWFSLHEHLSICLREWWI